MLTTKKQQAIVATSNNNSKKAILVALGVIVSLSVFVASGRSGTDMGSYKQTICTGKAIDFAQKGIIRDVGGFNGAIYECTHMNYPYSIYGDVSSAAVVMHNKGV